MKDYAASDTGTASSVFFDHKVEMESSFAGALIDGRDKESARNSRAS